MQTTKEIGFFDKGIIDLSVNIKQQEGYFELHLGEGLFTGDELNSKSFDDKDSKTQFLVKLIMLTEMVIQEKIDIKPSMVLAGQQADKTNIWLQQMYRAAVSGVDTGALVA